MSCYNVLSTIFMVIIIFVNALLINQVHVIDGQSHVFFWGLELYQ